jgi:pimeloyl-ACP methyl ester carboxylesterase
VAAVSRASWPVGLRRVRPWPVRYLGWDGKTPCDATVVLPRAWGPRYQPRPLPLVISPHGRNNLGFANAARYWKELPADGQFALVCPDGLGRAHDAASDPVDDLARMPSIVRETLPWLDLDLTRVYALGSSMGGQETLLLAARYPQSLRGGTGRLAGAAAFDSPCDLVAQCGYLTRRPLPPDGNPQAGVAARMIEEIGARPADRTGWRESARFYDFRAQRQSTIGALLAELPQDETRWDERSPLRHAAQLASLPFPLRLYWSSRDTVVGNQATAQTGRLFEAILLASPKANVVQVKGTWPHSEEFEQGSPFDRIGDALRSFGLIPPLPV